MVDYQSDGCLALARTLGRPPHEIATEVLARVDLSGLATATVSGPGFINVTLFDPVLNGGLAALHADARLGVPSADSPETVVIDYSAPNVAKEMHVGAPPVYSHRRRGGPGAGLVGPRRAAGQPHRRLGHAVRNADRTRAGRRRGGGCPRTVHW
jgi:hypothetical protein